MKAALLRALAAHDARTSDDAPDSSRMMCGADCGGSPCSRMAGHRDRCDPEGADPSPLRGAISTALARPGAPTQAALARAAGVTPQNLSAWLKGRRTIPQRAIEAMLTRLDLVIVPRTEPPPVQRERCGQRHPELRGRRCALGLGHAAIEPGTLTDEEARAISED